jgi:hypothetical protein
MRVIPGTLFWAEHFCLYQKQKVALTSNLPIGTLNADTYI